jgi:hypothetical protein
MLSDDVSQDQLMFLFSRQGTARPIDLKSDRHICKFLTGGIFRSTEKIFFLARDIVIAPSPSGTISAPSGRIATHPATGYL